MLSRLARDRYAYVDVVDMDDVETGNLGFQPLFDSSDIGKKKAEVAMQKCYGTTNSPNHRCFLCSVQRMDLSQLTSYDAIFGCVDNLEARFYINSVVLQCKDKAIVYIDGGSMGLGGQAQLIIPHVLLVVSHQEGDSLLPLSLLSVSRPRNRAVSSLVPIVSHPTLPEHCITYAKQILWEKERRTNSSTRTLSIVFAGQWNGRPNVVVNSESTESRWN